MTEKLEQVGSGIRVNEQLDVDSEYPQASQEYPRVDFETAICGAKNPTFAVFDQRIRQRDESIATVLRVVEKIVSIGENDYSFAERWGVEISEARDLIDAMETLRELAGNVPAETIRERNASAIADLDAACSGLESMVGEIRASIERSQELVRDLGKGMLEPWEAQVADGWREEHAARREAAIKGLGLDTVPK